MEESKKLFNFVSLGKTHDDIKKNLPFTDPCLDPLNVWTAYGFAVGLGQYYTYLIRPKWLGNNEPIAEHHTYFDAIMGLWFNGIWGFGKNRDEVFVRGFFVGYKGGFRGCGRFLLAYSLLRGRIC